MDLAHLRMLEARGLLLQALELGEIMACDHQASLTERMEASLICASCAVRRGDYCRGHEFAMQAEALAAEAGNQEGIALAKSFAGSACVLSGQAAEAEEALLRFLAVAADFPELRCQRGHALHGLARSYELQRRHETAISLYRQAADDFERQGMVAKAIDVHQGAAWLLLRMGNPTDAADHLCMAHWMGGDADREQRARQQALDAYHFHLLGEQNQAVDLAHAILTHDPDDALPWPRTLAAYLATAVALEFGRPDIAGAMLSVALAHVHRTQDPNLMNMVGELRGALKV